MRKTKTVTFIILGIYCAIALFMACVCVVKVKTAKTYAIDFSTLHLDETDTDYQFSYKTDCINLPAGNYVLNIDYISNGGVGKVEAFYDNDYMASLELAHSGGQMSNASTAFELEKPSDWMHLFIKGDESIQLAYIGILSDKIIYSDHLYYALLWILSIPFAYIIISLFIKSKDKHAFLILCGICLISIFPVMIDGNAVRSGVDIRDHMLRIDGIFMGLREKQWPVIINPNMNNQFGQTAALYPGFFLYIAGILRLFRISIQTAYKTITVIVHVSNILAMYFSAKYISKSCRAALFAAFGYLSIIMSYYIQGSTLATGLASIFIPITIAGIYGALERRSKTGGYAEYAWLALPIGFFGIVASHVLNFVLTTLMTVLILAAYFIMVLIFKNKKTADGEICDFKAFFSLIGKSVLLFIGLSVGIIVPFAVFYMNGFNQEALDITDFYGNCLTLRDFATSNTIMAAALVLCVVTLLYINRNKAVKYDKKIFAIFIAGVILVVMCTKIFPWKLLLKIGFINSIADMIQWPGRMTIQATACFCLTLAYNMSILSTDLYKDHGKKLNMASGIIIAVSAILFAAVKYNTYIENDNIVFDKLTQAYIYRNNDDYLPKDTKTEYYSSAVGKLSDDEKIQVHKYKKLGTRVWFDYETDYDDEYAEFPLFYYKGYHAVDENGREYELTCGDRNFVRMSLPKTEDVRHVYISYKVNVIYKICVIVSCFIFIYVVVLLIKNIRREFYA